MANHLAYVAKRCLEAISPVLRLLCEQQVRELGVRILAEVWDRIGRCLDLAQFDPSALACPSAHKWAHSFKTSLGAFCCCRKSKEVTHLKKISGRKQFVVYEDFFRMLFNLVTT